MPGNFRKEDLRVLKTHKAIITAMSTLLKQRKFAQITVNDLCEEAQIGRPTFYDHFQDKYDLLEHWLEHWLKNLKAALIKSRGSYEDVAMCINEFVNNNKKVIKNLIEDVNDETYQLLCDFIFLLLEITVDKTYNEKVSPKYIVLSKFCSGGIMNYLKWQLEQKFPTDSPVMNPDLYDIIINIKRWSSELE